MAELSPLEEKLAEVMGLAQATQAATNKVAKLTKEDQNRQLLKQMSEEAKQTADRAHEAISKMEGRKTAMERRAREAKRELGDMAKTYLDSTDVDELDGFEFLVMAEAGELGHVEVIEKINEGAHDAAVDELVRFAKPIQERHFNAVHETVLAIAAKEGAATA